LFQAIVFNGLDNCFGNLRGDVVSPARFDVPVDEHEDMVDNRPVQPLSLETSLDDFVYLIDSDGWHPPSLRWLKRVERKSPARADLRAQCQPPCFCEKKKGDCLGGERGVALLNNRHDG